MPITHTVGPITVTALLDGAGPAFLTRTEAFPDAGAAQWSEADRLDPGAVTAEGAWWLRLQEIEGGLVLAPGVRIVPTPGHTPGHQSVWAYAGSESVLVTGDLLVHAPQLIDPDLAYASDMDPAQARVTRRAVLDDARARGAVAAVAHLGTSFRSLGA
jgi:glyoxylase-like metal-dependent hydrolase (beta-lactamase superfamily II)